MSSDSAWEKQSLWFPVKRHFTKYYQWVFGCSLVSPTGVDIGCTWWLLSPTDVPSPGYPLLAPWLHGHSRKKDEEAESHCHSFSGLSWSWSSIQALSGLVKIHCMTGLPPLKLSEIKILTCNSSGPSWFEDEDLRTQLLWLWDGKSVWALTCSTGFKTSPLQQI